MEYQTKLNLKLQDTAAIDISAVVLHQLLYQQISSTTFWNFIQHYLKKNISNFVSDKFTQTPTLTPLTAKICCM